MSKRNECILVTLILITVICAIIMPVNAYAANIGVNSIIIDYANMTADGRTFLSDYKDNYVNDKKPVFMGTTTDGYLYMMYYQVTIYERLATTTLTTGTSITSTENFKLCLFKLVASNGHYQFYHYYATDYTASTTLKNFDNYLVNLSNKLTWIGANSYGSMNKADNINYFVVLDGSGNIDSNYSFNTKNVPPSSSTLPPSLSSSSGSGGSTTPPFDNKTFIGDMVDGLKGLFIPQKENLISDSVTEVQDAFKEKINDNALSTEKFETKLSDLKDSNTSGSINVGIPENAFFEGSVGSKADLAVYLKPAADYIKPILTAFACLFTYLVCRSKVLALLNGKG